MHSIGNVLGTSYSLCFSLFVEYHYFILLFIGFFLALLPPQPQIEPRPPAVEAWSPSPWTTREVPA